jgi:hypothetical protein
MTTITSQDGRDHDERVHAIGAVLSASLILSGLLLGAALVASQVVDLVTWAFAGR